MADEALTSAAGRYVLGPGDVIAIRVPHLDEYGGTTSSLRIDSSGDVRLPLLGTVRAAGFTVERMQVQVAEKLSRLMNHPDVSIVVKEFAGQRRG